ncbi:unnamed protein product [Arctogadus glacialis]
MSGFLRLLLSRRPRLISKANVATPQRANYIISKPAKDHIGVLETIGVMTVMCLAILGPSGWILVHIKDYRKGE